MCAYGCRAKVRRWWCSRWSAAKQGHAVADARLRRPLECLPDQVGQQLACGHSPRLCQFFHGLQDVRIEVECRAHEPASGITGSHVNAARLVDSPRSGCKSNSVTQMRPSPSAPPVREFELVVLLAVLSLRDEGYPVSIRDAIEDRTRRQVSRAAVFITLERLESKGFVTSRYGDPTPVRGGRAKRFFQATPAGVKAAKEAVRLMRSMTAGLEEVLG